MYLDDGKLEDYQFKNVGEIVRLYEQGFAVLTFKAGTEEEYDALVEFTMDCLTPINIKYPLSYLKACDGDGMRPSNYHFAVQTGKTADAVRRHAKYREETANMNIADGNFYHLNSQIKRAKEIDLPFVDVNLFGFKEVSNDTLALLEIEKTLLKRKEVEDVEFIPQGVRLKLE